MQNKFSKLTALLIAMIGALSTQLLNAQISSNLSFSTTSGPLFYVDANSCGVAAPTANFVTVKATNSGSTTIDVGTLTLDSMPSGWVVRGPANATAVIGKLVAGQSKVVYFYVHANCADKGKAVKIRFKANNGANTQYYRMPLDVEGVITAASAGSISSTVQKLDVIGSIVTDRVTFAYQGFSSGNHLFCSPSTLYTFKGDLLELISVEVDSCASGLGLTAGDKDKLYFNPTFKASGSTNYAVRQIFKWRIVGYGDSTLLVPFSMNQQGGTNLKGLVADSSWSKATGKPIVVSANANTISVSKSCDKIKYSPGVDTLTYTITIANSSSSASVSIDKIVDLLPTGFEYVRLAAGTDYTLSKLSSVPAAGATGTLNFVGGVTDATSGEISLVVPAGSSKTLKIRVFATASATGSLTNTASAYIYTNLLDTGVVTIVEGGAPTVTVVTATNPTCNGGSDGSVKISGYDAPRPFTWSKDGTTYGNDSVFTGLSAGTYTFYVKSASGKVSTKVVTLTDPAAVTITGTTSVCVGSTTTLTGSGTAASSNPWVSASTGVATVNSSGVVTGVSAGSSVVTYTDNNGCTATETVVVNALPTITGTFSICGTGTSALTGSGTAATSNPWVSSATSVATVNSSGLVTGVSAGTSSITYTDNNGCSTSQTVTVNNSPSITGTTGICGTSTSMIFGSGTPATSNPWVSASTAVATINSSGVVTGVSAGTSVITYTDNNGCTATVTMNVYSEPTVSGTSSICGTGTTSLTATGTPAASNAWVSALTGIATVSGSSTVNETVTGVSAGTAYIIYTDNHSCTATVSVSVYSNPTVSVSPTSATIVQGNSQSLTASGASTYSWSPATGLSATTGSSVTATPSSTTTYTVTGTDANGCTGTATSAITVTSSLSGGTVASNQTICSGATPSSFTSSVAASGGTGTLSYQWQSTSAGGSSWTDISGATSATYSFSSGLTSSTDYRRKVTDAASSVQYSNTVSITVNANPTATIASSTNVGCYGASTGSINLTASGTATLSYAWTGPNSYTATTEDISSLAAGTYNVTVTDGNSCTATTSATLTEPTAALSLSNSSQTNVLCYGNSTGAVTVAAAGGTSPYTYKIGTGTYGSSATFTGLAAGTYTITAQDANNCTQTLSVTITQPAAALSSSSVAITHVSCNGGSNGAADITVSGGTTPYTYAWSGPFSYNSTSEDITGLSAGTYSVTVTDASGCTSTNNSVTVTQPTALSASSVTVTNLTCNGSNDGSAASSPSGGTGTYTYSWSTGSTNASITGLSAGTYSVTVTDANSCTAVNASVVVTEPTAVSVTNSSQTNVLCNGNSTGAVTVSASGGSGSYTYQIGSGSFASSATFSGLAAGTYTITAKDAQGCTGTLSVTITQPAALSSSSVSVTDVSCNGGTDGAADITVSGGTTPYTYAWSGPSSYSATTEDITGLSAGTYTVVVTDAKSCTSTNSSVVVGSPTALTLSNGSQTNVACYGNSTGSVTVTAGGGTSPYTYKIGTGSYGASSTFGSLAAGTYTITVKDANNCTQTLSVTITEPAAALSVSSTVTTTPVSCNGGSDGTADITVTGGTTPYTFAWTGTGSYTSSVEDPSNFAAGIYSVSVTDANGCTASKASISITEPAAATISSVTYTDPSCDLASDGTITITAAGGNTLTYSIDSGTSYQNTGSFTGLSKGPYKIAVSDSKGCTVINNASTNITLVNGDYTNPVASAKNVTVYLNASGSASINYTDMDNGSSDNCEIVDYKLSDSTFDCSEVGSKTVTMTVTDKNGNNASTTATVTVVDARSPIPSAKNATVYLNATGAASITWSDIDNGSSDACGIQKFVLSDSTFDCNDTGVNVVTVTVYDVNGNTSTSTVNVTIQDVTKPTAITKNITVNLNASGSISITAADVNNGTNDNCGIKSLSVSPSSFTCSDTGVNKVILTAVDGSGNTDTAHAYVTVKDVTKPTAITQNISISLDATGAVSITASDVNSGSNDNCGIKSLSVSPSSFTCSDTGVNKVILTAVDGSGNTDTAHAYVTVSDTTKPIVLTKNLVLALDANGQVSFTAADIDNASSDNCGIKSLSVNPSTFSCADTGKFNVVTLTAVDGSGNTQTATATVRVFDTSAPTVKAQDITVYLDVNGVVSTNYTLINNGSFDNCSIREYNIVDSSFDCSDTGVHNLMLIATDYSGNSAFAAYNVTVLDTMKPVVVTKTHTVWLDTAAKASMVNVDVIASITDNCGTIDTLVSQYTFTLNDTGWVDVDVWVTDKNGNTTGPVRTRVLVLIRDSDNDSIPDYIEGSDDKDGDGVYDFMDLDSDNDGILDVVENEGKDYLLDLDLDGTPDYKDLDTDNDGFDDVVEVDGNDPDFDGIAGNGPAVVDANGVPTIANGGYAEVFTDADAQPDYKDLDTDNDGILDSVERGPSKDPVDTDSDGTRDWRDLDSDNDGISDQIETDIDTDGDGTGDWRDLDTDNDGISDQIETDVDTDGDGTGDWRDLDSDNDGISDQIETDRDTDGDGTGDWRDLDTDNDGLGDDIETDFDTDGDGVGDWRDLDVDNDGILDIVENEGQSTELDLDGDGTPNYKDLDTDDDTIDDIIEVDGSDPDLDGIAGTGAPVVDANGVPVIAAGGYAEIFTDADALPDYKDIDADEDGILDWIERGPTKFPVDTDSDGKGDWRDLDSDNDGISDEIETDIDTDGDGVGDWRDLDSDDDGISDEIETDVDTDGDGIGDWRDLDSDNDEVDDATEGTGDRDKNGIPDWRDPQVFIPEGFSPNGDGTNDVLYIKGLKNYPQAKLTVFNRWGQIVYESPRGYQNDWDGVYNGKTFSIGQGPLPENVYFLLFEFNGTGEPQFIKDPISGNLYIKR